MVLTDRFVKWINRQNVFSGCEGYQSGIRGSTTGAVDNNDPSMNNATDCFCEDFGMDGDSGLFWECIPNTQQQSSIELSSKNRGMQNNDSNTTSTSGAPITTSNSEATQNSIAIGGSSSSQWCWVHSKKSKTIVRDEMNAIKWLSLSGPSALISQFTL